MHCHVIYDAFHLFIPYRLAKLDLWLYEAEVQLSDRIVQTESSCLPKIWNFGAVTFGRHREMRFNA